MLEFFASDIGKVALGGLIAISGQLLVFVLGWIKESRFSQKKQMTEAQHLGIRLVLALDKLVGDCYSAVNDPLTTDRNGLTVSTVPNPQFALPEGGDYRALPTQIMYDIMSMPNRLVAIEESLAWESEYSSPPDYEEYYVARAEKLSVFGLKAIGQIESLCALYRIPAPEWPEHYDPRQGLQNHLLRIEQNRLRYQSRIDTSDEI